MILDVWADFDVDACELVWRREGGIDDTDVGAEGSKRIEGGERKGEIEGDWTRRNGAGCWVVRRKGSGRIGVERVA